MILIRAIPAQDETQHERTGRDSHVSDLQLNQKRMPDSLQNCALGIDVLHLFQSHNLRLVQDLHGIVWELIVDVCRFLRAWCIWVSRLL